MITTKGKKVIIVGVIKKQGNQMLGGWQLDDAVVMPYRYARTIMDERNAEPLILVQGLDNLQIAVLKDDLKGAMRAINKLSPAQEDNFSLNDVNEWSKAFEAAFSGINMGGMLIGGISLIVGLFGVANIMFVSVKERTSQIGLKKAIGAKSISYLLNFYWKLHSFVLSVDLLGWRLYWDLQKFYPAHLISRYIFQLESCNGDQHLLCRWSACRYHTCDNCGKIESGGSYSKQVKISQFADLTMC
jgi:putative ABC transport system permease protein